MGAGPAAAIAIGLGIIYGLMLAAIIAGLIAVSREERH
jgi:hypothetical protein